MTETTLLHLISGGENSGVQFKADINNPLSASQEIVAFANSKGGKLIVGVSDKTGEVIGLSFSDLQRVNNLLTTAANDLVKSPLVIETETVDVGGKKVIVAHVPEGKDKPHTDKDGLIFIKNGSDKRKVTSREELARLLQSSGNLYAEQMLLQQSSIKDLDWILFRDFYEKRYKMEIAPEEFQTKVENLSLGAEGKINVAGNLLFGKKTQRLCPDAYVSAVWFHGTELSSSHYRSSENIEGDLASVYKGAQRFIFSTLRKLQNGKDFNSVGDMEISEVAINEVLINALIHRDYFIHDSIKVFVFDDRLEIRSPGKLPNSLTPEQVKSGVSRRRNHILASYASDVIPYRGIGSGILRTLQTHPRTEFYHLPEVEQFNVVMYRPD